MGFKKEDKPDLTIPADSIVVAELDELKIKTINWTDKKTGEAKSADMLEWWWRVVEGEYEGRKVKGECNAELSNHPQNRFNNWAEATLGQEIPLGYDLEPDDLVGLKALISVKHRQGTGNYSDRVFEEVDEVMAYTRGDDDVPF